MTVYHLDYETYSPEDISLGAHKYAEHPETEILICAIARGDEEPVVWRCDQDKSGDFMSLLAEIETYKDITIYAHNSQFETAITAQLWEKTFGTPAPDLRQWRCTASMARRAAIPSNLKDCAEFLDLSVGKDSEGKRLIRKFSLPQKPTKKQPKTRILPQDDPEDFEKFVQYCYQDVVVERAIHKKLRKFELKGDVLESFLFDAEMNARGVPVNVEALERTNALVEKFNTKLTEKFRSIVGLNPTQGVKFKAWLQDRGYPAKDLQAATVENVLSNNPELIGMTPEAIEALQLKTLVGFAALKKIPTMLAAACRDGRVRGSLMWSGAERTHRWAGRTIQPQNFKRPVIKDTEVLYDLLCTTKLECEDLEMLHDNPLLSIASCIRHFIQPEHDRGLFDADYSAIEARIAPWLCGSEEKLQLFRDKAPIYERMGAKIFGKTTEEVVANAKTENWRFVGKRAELGCTYNMGGKKFRSSCLNFGQDVDQKTAELAVKTWRTDSANVPIVEAWRNIGDAAVSATKQPGKRFQGTDKITFIYQNVGFRALVAKLPSGHCLIYPKAKLVPVWSVYQGGEAHKFYSEEKAIKFQSGLGVKIRKANANLPPKKQKTVPSVRSGEEIQFWGKSDNKWCWQSTYGGKLLENLTQACAGDIMAHGALRAAELGYLIFMLVHDQAIAEVFEGGNIEEFCAALCTLPNWAKGLPLEAEGSVIPFYKKD
jgi:DNA polymerase